MKRVLLTLIMSIVFGGTIFAQWYPTSEYYNPNNYETYFNTAYDFNPGNYMYTDYPIAYLQCNNELIGLNDNWADYEVASFVDGVLRGFCFMSAQYSSQFWDWGYEIPMFDGIFVFNAGDGEVVTFKVYDHSTGIEYECTTNMEVITGGDYSGVYDDPEGVSPESLIISFTKDEPVGFNKDIIGYTGDTDHYYLISTPIGTVNPTAVTNMVEPNDYDLYYFDQTADALEWKNYKSNNFTLEPKVGYLYANAQDVTLTFNGEAYDGDGTVALSLEEGHNLSGWNLIGNPYATTATLNDGYRAFYVMNDSFELVEAESEIINPMEGIFVQAATDGEEVVFAPATEGNKISKLSLRVNDANGNFDRARINFGMGGQLGKIQINPNHTKIYFPVDGEDFAVVSSNQDMDEMPVAFKAENSGSYTISFSNANVEFNYLHLIDNMTGKEVDLLETPTYSFEASNTDYANRFKLVFATGNNNEDNFAFFSNGSFVISNEGEATLQVVDVTGRILMNETIIGSTSVNVDAAPGVYMLRLVNGNNVKVQKVVVK